MIGEIVGIVSIIVGAMLGLAIVSQGKKVTKRQTVGRLKNDPELREEVKKELEWD